MRYLALVLSDAPFELWDIEHSVVLRSVERFCRANTVAWCTSAATLSARPTNITADSTSSSKEYLICTDNAGMLGHYYVENGS